MKKSTEDKPYNFRISQIYFYTGFSLSISYFSVFLTPLGAYAVNFSVLDWFIDVGNAIPPKQKGTR